MGDSGSARIRQLEEGEKIEILEGPKDEKLAGLSKIKGRCLSDDKVGWMCVAMDMNLKPWNTRYRCIKPVAVTEELKAEDATEVRKLGLGETVMFLEGPKEDAGVLRIKGEMDKDGAVGWISFSEKDGPRFL